jgi:hypothetical protein
VGSELNNPFPPAVPAGGAAHGANTAAEPHVCPSCSSHLVYPLEWAPVDMCHWRVELRCPECEWTSAGLYEQSALDRFDQILDDGTDALLEDYRRLQRSNMEAELERFSLALSTDLVMPEDF